MVTNWLFNTSKSLEAFLSVSMQFLILFCFPLRDRNPGDWTCRLRVEVFSFCSITSREGSIPESGQWNGLHVQPALLN